MLAKKYKNSIFLLTFIVMAFSTNIFAAELDVRRIRSGLKLFKSVLAADRDLARKRAVDGKLLALLIYTDEQQKAEELAKELTNKLSGSKPVLIRKMQLKTKVVHISDLKDYADKRVAGVYLTQALGMPNLANLIHFGIDKRLIVYSPFEGDVHKGVFVGMSIGTRAYPLINLDTMEASKLRIKSFFLKVAKKYES